MEKPKNSRLRITQIIGFEAVIVLLLVCGVVIVLNYFSVVPLSKNYPRIFTWLPHQEIEKVEEKKPVQITASITIDEPYFACPIASNDCTKATIIYDLENKEYFGYGFQNVYSGSPVVSLTTGSYSVQKNDAGKITIKILEKNGDIEAEYQFFGNVTIEASGQIERGEAIGTLGDETVSISQSSQKYGLVVGIKNSKTNKGLNLPQLKLFESKTSVLDQN